MTIPSNLIPYFDSGPVLCRRGGVKKNISMCKLEGRYEGPKEGRDNKQAEQGNFLTFWFFKRKLYLRCYIQKTKKLKNYKYG